MSTSSNLDRICVAALALAVLIAALAFCAPALGYEAASGGVVLSYEERLFDTSVVHTIDIVMDDWEGFIAGCEDEEYVLCDLVIDGEDWGLYLAVEGVEESFLLRNYGTDYGELYKPDSMEMGGGRGSGGGFDMDQFQERFENDEFSLPEGTDVPGEGEFSPPEGEEMPAEGGFDRGEGGFGGRGGMGGMPSDMGEPPEDMGGMPDMSEMPEMGEIPDMGEVPEMGEMPEMGGGMMGGSSDVLLVYTDDDYDSYANIFDNAKTDVSNADKDRLIDALQALGEGGDVSDCVDIESVFTSGEFERLFDETVELISPYVERDPTKFCTYEEFELGAETLREFCLLRAESIGYQLAGEDVTVDASGLDISAMGSMNNTAGGGGKGFRG